MLLNSSLNRFASKGKGPHSTKQVVDLDKINEKVEKKLEKDRKKAVCPPFHSLLHKFHLSHSLVYIPTSNLHVIKGTVTSTVI